MKGFYLRYIGRRRNAAAIGLINLIYNLARYEQDHAVEVITAASRLKNGKVAKDKQTIRNQNDNTMKQTTEGVIMTKFTPRTESQTST